MIKATATNNWIFLRGLARGTGHWGNFPEIFQKINPTATVEYLDLPGNGTLNKQRTSVDAAEVVAQLKKNSRLYASGIPFRICGLSLGGMIALKWAELDTKNLISVAVINSSLNQLSPFYDRLQPKNYFNILRTLLTSKSLIQEKLILEMTSNNFKDTGQFLLRFAEYSAYYPTGKNNFLRQLQLARRIQIKKPLKIKVDVIFSAADRLVHKNCSIALAQNFSGHLHAHPTAGHDIALDDSEWLCRLLTKISLAEDN